MLEKSVYSLLLSDSVVGAVDEMAFQQNTSRSNLINQILAEYASLVTPEKRRKDVFEELSQLLLGQGYQLLTQPSDSMFSIKSVLRYKYKPTIRYSVELYREVQQAYGEIRVASRTQSGALIGALEDFYELWERMEQTVGRSPAGSSGAVSANGRYTRPFRIQERDDRISEDQVGEAIARFIQCFDSAMKAYFDGLDLDPRVAGRQIAALYREYCDTAMLVL